LRWREASQLIKDAIRETIAGKEVTQDLAGHMPGVIPPWASEDALFLVDMIKES